MRSVVEEKSNRVIEVLDRGRPSGGALLGKVVGMGAVARTQLVAWSLLSTAAFTAFQFVFDSGALTGGAMAMGDEVPADLLTVMAENEFTSILLDIDWGDGTEHRGLLHRRATCSMAVSMRWSAPR